jgi:hypothetical protein
MRHARAAAHRLGHDVADSFAEFDFAWMEQCLLNPFGEPVWRDCFEKLQLVERLSNATCRRRAAPTRFRPA